MVRVDFGTGLIARRNARMYLRHPRVVNALNPHSGGVNVYQGLQPV